MVLRLTPPPILIGNCKWSIKKKTGGLTLAPPLTLMGIGNPRVSCNFLQPNMKIFASMKNGGNRISIPLNQTPNINMAYHEINVNMHYGINKNM